MKTAEYWIDKLKLEPHPEGGYYRETYRSSEVIPKTVLPERFDGDRVFSTCIFFLLDKKNYSAFHRINQEEIWHFYDGVSLTIHMINPDGTSSAAKLGTDLDKGEYPHIIVKAGCYFAAEVNNREYFTLAGCTVAPGFEFADFYMPDRNELIELFPQHAELIKKFTR